jgi:hypothetical protein
MSRRAEPAIGRVNTVLVFGPQDVEKGLVTTLMARLCRSPVVDESQTAGRYGSILRSCAIIVAC